MHKLQERSLLREKADGRKATGRYHIETWGCQMNVHDSEKLSGALERDGYVRADGREDADVILLNTCSIREKAAEKMFSELGRFVPYKRRNPELVIGVCGCVAQQEGERIFRRSDVVDFVVGPRATATVTRTLERIRNGDVQARGTVDTEYRNDSIRFPYDEIRREGVGTGKAFVTVIEGCNHRCTYCVVPNTRGREICRPMTSILGEVGSLASQGVMEMEFLGQTVNAYRDEDGNTLADLLPAAAEIEGVRRLRFTTSHPAQMTDRLMDAMASASPTVCPYLHLPVQAGSSEVLKRMRRGYDREGYLRKIEGLRRRMPDMLFGTDVIVGFPGESEEQFEETLSLLNEVAYDTVYSFAYSERPATKALELDGGMPQAEKHERLRRLQEQQKTLQERRNRQWVGRDVEVLVEGRSKRNPERWTGRTPENRVVNFDGEAFPGQLKNVKLLDSSAFCLIG
ncbi:MAG: tRNA (N6-isopentenyl adenosine(37)-C2)-methylthiotransferase MiaB [bacterium]|nr:tRNA (N6-isopentenyl adenosine(37)-C2)-methylthiotransferase MiaB [bacterium]